MPRFVGAWQRRHPLPLRPRAGRVAKLATISGWRSAPPPKRPADAADHPEADPSITVAVASAAMPSRRPVKPSPSVVVALTLTRPPIEVEQLGDAPAHGVAVRGDLRGLAEHGDVDVADRAAACAYKSNGLAQEDGGGGALPARVRVGEMLADVARADGAEQRVGERVQGDVGVGMALQGVRVGDPDAAQPDVVAGDQPVHVEALSGAHVGSAVQRRSAMARSSAVVSLMLAALPMTSVTGSCRPFRDRGVVGHVVPAGGRGALVCGQDVARSGSLAGSAPATVPRARAWRRCGCRARPA